MSGLNDDELRRLREEHQKVMDDMDATFTRLLAKLDKLPTKQDYLIVLIYSILAPMLAFDAAWLLNSQFHWW